MATRPPTIRLELLQYDDPTELAELHRQRVLCSWDSSKIDLWREQSRAGLKAIYWMHPLDPSSFPLVEVPGIDSTFRPLGHIALDFVDADEDDEVANRELGNVCLATFFVLTELRGRGVGREAISHLATIASNPPFSAKYLTLETWTAENTKSQAYWDSIGRPRHGPDHGEVLHKEDWYARLGFVKWKTLPRYPYTNRVTGEKMMLDLAYMRKAL